MDLYFSKDASFALQETQHLDDKSVHHCLNVLRKKNGDSIYLTNGLGIIAKAVLLQTETRKCVVQIKSIIKQSPKRKHFGMAISLLKNADRIEWLLEKATELGISEVFLMTCQRTEKLGIKETRLQQILISAMLQSQQCWLPRLHTLQSFEQTINQTKHYENKWIAHCIEDETKIYYTHLPIMASEMNIFFIGPEGDFTKKEIEFAMQQKHIAISLGENRLRTETAGLLLCGHFYSQFKS